MIVRKPFLASGISWLLSIVAWPVFAAEQPLAAPLPGYKLVFSDEFCGEKDAPPDPKIWSPVHAGEKWRDAWYQEEACRLDGNGNLVITTRRNGDRVETGMVNSQGKYEVKHGYIECRCKVQTQEGVWSAFWLHSPTMGKPIGDPGKAGVEIDVMEYLAVKAPDTVHHTIHWDGYQEGIHKKVQVRKHIPGLSEGFHTYAVKWDEQGYVFYTDGKESGRLPSAPVSNRSQFLWLSCEVGLVEWTGDIANATLPDTFVVDYVRVWQTPLPPCAMRHRSRSIRSWWMTFESGRRRRNPEQHSSQTPPAKPAKSLVGAMTNHEIRMTNTQ